MNQYNSKINTRHYETWYEFKKELERSLGHMLYNPKWLAIKPHSPLPWSHEQFNRALAAARRHP